MNRCIGSWLERTLAIGGLACLVYVGWNGLDRWTAQRSYERDLNRVALVSDASNAIDRTISGPPIGQVIGRLEVPRLGLVAMVAEGDDEATLRRAVGHLPDTPLPWQEGNSALAGHRDSFFRPLRRIAVGDRIVFSTSQGTFEYRVTRYGVVDPNTVSVLESGQQRDLTLITCFPFDYIGSAPRRFVVHASRVSPNVVTARRVHKDHWQQSHRRPERGNVTAISPVS